MENILKKIKSNKGFTIQDVIIAIVVISMFAAIIGGTYLSVYQIQVKTKISSVASLCGIKIIEYIDKVSYEQVTNDMLDECRNELEIPSAMGLQLEVSKYNEEDTIKKVKLVVSYNLKDEEQNLVLEKLKMKEI